jgi:poly-gamma-glutamate synthesis protein (capsule biosynthesis protein)
MFDRQVAVYSGSDLTHPFAKIGNVKDGAFGSVDLAVANVEGPVTAHRVPTYKSIQFAFDPRIAPVIKAEGFDAVSQANNHSLDQGRAGATVSRQTLAAAGLSVFGDQIRDDASSSLAYVTVDQHRIALLGYHTVDRTLDLAAVSSTIAMAKQQADLVIVFMHWGVEYTPKPRPDQVDLAHWFIDHGVDAVIGGHPHWMQTVGVYKGRPIVYSLGNFVFDQDWSYETRQGLAVRFDIGPSSRSLTFYPVELTKSQPVVLTGKERDARLARLASFSDPVLTQEIEAGRLELPVRE